MQQAISWAKVDSELCHYTVPLGHSEFVGYCSLSVVLFHLVFVFRVNYCWFVYMIYKFHKREMLRWSIYDAMRRLYFSTAQEGVPVSKVHVANMGPTWVLLAPWTLLSGVTWACVWNFHSMFQAVRWLVYNFVMARETILYFQMWRDVNCLLSVN